jgi:cyanophycinase
LGCPPEGVDAAVSVYLVGGGWSPGATRDVYGAFAGEVLGRGGRLVYVLQSGTPGHRFVDLFASLGITTARRATVARDRELSLRDLKDADGLFVCGGMNPLYRQALVPAAGRIRELVADGVPYAGFSAGAVVAANVALLGGWLRRIDGRDLPVCRERRNENLGRVETGPGLGLVPFAVDVHGTQWGTLTRALHAVDAGLVEDCVLVDEDTVLRVSDGQAQVAGRNCVYRVRSRQGAVTVEVLTTGGVIDYVGAAMP